MSDLISSGKIHDPSSFNINLNLPLTKRGVMSEIFNLGSFIENYIKLIFKGERKEMFFWFVFWSGLSSARCNTVLKH